MAVDKVIVDINAIGGLVLRQRQSLVADGGLPLHPLDQILGMLAIANAENARPCQGDTLPQ